MNRLRRYSSNTVGEQKLRNVAMNVARNSSIFICNRDDFLLLISRLSSSKYVEKSSIPSTRTSTRRSSDPAFVTTSVTFEETISGWNEFRAEPTLPGSVGVTLPRTWAELRFDARLARFDEVSMITLPGRDRRFVSVTILSTNSPS